MKPEEFAYLKNYIDMSEQRVINVYGIDPNWKPPTKREWHGTTYLEYEIPASLEKELSKMIDKRLKKFYNECKCKSCKEKRKSNKKN
jgi:hypothetical protein